MAPPIATFTVGYQWDDEGRMTSMQSPTVTPSSYSSWPYPTVMPTMGYQYDINGRMTEMTSNGSAFATASYTAAGQLYQLSYGGMTETRTYNSMMQLIAQSVPGYLNMTYNYSTTGHNNGRIVSSNDGITGENTTYTYDVLNRLTGASNSLWNQTYTYDGFGNLLTKSQANGSPNPSPSMSVSYNANNQQTSGVGYDANGNTNSVGSYSYGYTVENKMNSQTYNYWPFGMSLYAYDPWGKRVMKETNPDPNNYEGEDSPAWEFYFYSITGQRLVTMDCNNPNGNPIPSCWVVGESLYFKQRMLVSNGVYVVTDRLGSVRANTQGGTFAYYPYGEERTTNPNGLDKYATYFRDAAGQDYADQRYYNAGTGRFWSVDPGGIATASPGNPTSWNRYAYVQGDPVNYTDRGGREREAAGNDVNCWESPENPDCYSDGSGGGGGGPNTYLPEYPAPDQGGGGGNFAAFADVVTLTQLLRHELASELQNLSANCYKAFGTVGVTQQAMMNGANAMTFYDSTGAAGELTMTEVMSQYGPLGAAGAQTVQAYGTAQGADSSAAVDLQYVPAAPPVGPQAPPFYTPSVILTANFWNQPLGSDPYLVLVHEELHWVSNQGDDDLVKNLNIPQLAGKTSSYDLSAWLASGCGGH
jgi:RHS repeat-associated protein